MEFSYKECEIIKMFFSQAVKSARHLLSLPDGAEKLQAITSFTGQGEIPDDRLDDVTEQLEMIIDDCDSVLQKINAEYGL